MKKFVRHLTLGFATVMIVGLASCSISIEGDPRILFEDWDDWDDSVEAEEPVDADEPAGETDPVEVDELKVG